MGGIIIKQVTYTDFLIILTFVPNTTQALCSVGSESILQDTCGIIFLGTPHQGSSISLLGSIVSFLTKPLGSDTTLVMSLTVNNAGLSDLRRKFEDTLKKQLRRPHIVSFYETKATFLGRLSAGVIVPRDSASAHADEEVYIDTDHSGLNKCFSAKPELLDKLVDCIKKSRVPSRLEQVDKLLKTQYDAEKPYEKLNIIRLSEKVLPMGSCYINLSIVAHYDQAVSTASQSTTSNSSFSLSSRNAVADVDKKLLVDLPTIFGERAGSDGNITPRRILIRGRAGVGKTTLCKKMVHDFLDRGMWKSIFDRVLWIPLRNLKGRQDSRYNLKSLFYDEFFSQISDGEKLADQLWEVVDSRTLFVLDGMDEVSQLIDSEGDMATFLAMLLRQPSVVITSRPSINLPPGVTVDLELETIGFSQEQVQAYLKADPKYIPRANEIETLLQRNWMLGSLVRIPIQLDALCFIWETIDPDKAPETMTGIYSEIVYKLWTKDIDRLQSQTYKWYAQPLPGEIEIKAKNEIAFLECLAFSGLCNDTIDFSHEDRSKAFQYLAKENPEYALNPTIDDVLPRLSFMRSSNSTRPHMPQKFHFIHLTYQEYFAARWFKRHWVTYQPLSIFHLDGFERKSADDFVRQHKYTARFNNMWRFVSGLCDLEPHDGRTVGDLFDLFGNEPIDLLGVTHHRLLMHCVAEVVKSVSLRMSIERRLSMWLQFECNLLDEPKLLCETEFPAGAIDTAFRTGSDRTKKMIVSAFKGRRITTQGVLELLVQGLKTPRASPELYHVIFDALGSRCEPFSTVVVEAVMSHMYSSDLAVAHQASYALGVQRTIPQPFKDRLLSQLLSHDQNRREQAARALRGQLQIPQTILSWLDNGSKSVKMEGLRAFKRWKDPPAYFSQAVVRLVGGENAKDVRKAALESTLHHDNLPDNVLRQIAAQLQDSDRGIRATAFKTLSYRERLPYDVLRAFVVFLSEDKNFDVYSHEYYTFRLVAQPSEPVTWAEILKAPVARFGHTGATLVKGAVDVFGMLPPFIADKSVKRLMWSQSDDKSGAVEMLAFRFLKYSQDEPWPCAFLSFIEEQVSIPVAYYSSLASLALPEGFKLYQSALKANLMQHCFPTLSLSALRTLMKRPELPAHILNAVKSKLRDPDNDIRWAAARVLKSQKASCPEILLELVRTLGDQDCRTAEIAKNVLCSQSKLEDEILVAMVNAAKRNTKVRSDVVLILKRYSPLDRKFQEDVVSLIEDESETIRRDALDILGCDTSLREDILLKVATMIGDEEISVKFAACNALKRQLVLTDTILKAPGLYHLWFKSSFEGDVYCYVHDGVIYLNMPFNLGNVQLKGNPNELVAESMVLTMSSLRKQLKVTNVLRRNYFLTILLQNGSVIVHDCNDRIQVRDNCDVLITNDVIEQIENRISPGKDTEVLDCTDKIISPGFIDTHHHLWQTQLKGYGLDNCWLDYFSDDLLQSFNYSAEDIYWGQVAGCLEALDAGTTFVLDHCHGCRTPEHAEAAIAAFADSGIRGTFAYAETFLNLAKWDVESCIPRATCISDNYIEHLEILAHKGPFANGRVTMGVAFDNYHLPQREVEKLFHRAIKAGVKLITSHCGNFGPSVPQALERYSLFPSAANDFTIVLSHGNYLGKPDLAMLSERQIPIACTPATEAQGSMGWPLLFEPGLNTALGADCHFLNSSSLMQAARNALLLSRLQKTVEHKFKGSKPIKFDETTCDAFNKATIQGARAVRMQDQIGSIQVGKQADILVFTRTSSLAFGTAARENPVAAIVGYSEPRDIQTVLVGGIFRKRAGTLVPIARNGETIGLDSIMSELHRSQEAIRKKRESCNLDLSRDLVTKIATPR
ncbi:hypothetical protein FSPOR_4130 [Fusarium sporotrichioides]|uniref:NACHT domain-containing protein n=1 Tax=Fusarium sporotrichioides TaxID=5514 RepID=A0A395SCY9_FUSSP|nr:hypothetical protein FSPOR_4130 [Fusarium sporotrichioides]